jgi:hypothetical protein
MVAMCEEGRGKWERVNLDGITSSNTVPSRPQPCVHKRASASSVVIGATTASINILSLLSGPMRSQAGGSGACASFEAPQHEAIVDTWI